MNNFTTVNKIGELCYIARVIYLCAVLDMRIDLLVYIPFRTYVLYIITFKIVFIKVDV